MPYIPRPLLSQEEFEALEQRRNADELLEVLSGFVRSTPGRKPKYSDAAERQREYRKRKKQAKAEGNQGSDEG